MFTNRTDRIGSKRTTVGLIVGIASLLLVGAFGSFGFFGADGASAETCVDWDGDGWGWNGTETCYPEETLPDAPPPCVDFDGDGWGWNGTETCLPATVTTPPTSATDFDCTVSRGESDVRFTFSGDYVGRSANLRNSTRWVASVTGETSFVVADGVGETYQVVLNGLGETVPCTPTATPTPTPTTTPTPAPTTTAPTPVTGTRRPYAQGNVGWERIASDDFNGSKLDDNMWEYGWWRTKGGSKYDRPVSWGETSCYHTDQVTLSGGALNLTMRPTTAAEDASGVCQKKDGSKAKFVSGYATTRNRYRIQPGTYVETRMYSPGEGDLFYNWPAFWSTDMDKAFGSQWPHSGEFDIAEVLRGKPCGNFHYATSAGGSHQQTGKRCTTVAANSWVVYGMKWNYDGTVEFFHDGKRVQDRNNGGDWMLDPVDLAGTFAKDYQHNIALQHGLPIPSKEGYKEPTAANPLTVKFDYVDVYKLDR